jgi:hypothetical protein
VPPSEATIKPRHSAVSTPFQTLTLPLSYLLLFFAPSGRAMTPSRLPV